MIYILILIILFLIAYSHEIKWTESKVLNVGTEKKTIQNRLFWSIYIMLSLFMGLRYRVGGDSLWFENLFNEQMPYLSDLSGFDFKAAYFYPGWYVLNAIGKSISNQFWTVQIIQSFFVNFVIFMAIMKLTKKKFTAVLVYYFFYYLYFNTEIMREAISVGFFTLGFNAIKTKCWKRYYVFALAAFAFHPSALFALIFPVIYILIPTDRKKILRYSGILIVFALTMNLPQLASLMPTEFLRGKAVNYFGQVSEIRSKIINVFSILLPFTFAARHLIKRNANNIFLQKMMVLSCYLIILQLFIGGIYRIRNYMVVIEIYMITECLYSTIHALVSNQKIKYGMLYTVLILIMFKVNYYNHSLKDLHYTKLKYFQRWYPYHSVFQPVIEYNRERGYFESMGHEN